MCLRNAALVALVLAMRAFGVTIATSSLPMGAAGVPYPAITLAATGGTGSGYIWSVSSGSLPPGLTLSPGGVLSGTPPVNSFATYTFTIQVQDSGGAAATKQFTLTVTQVLTVPTGSLPTATACATYPATVLSASGGTGVGYIWSVGSGSLPAGLSLSAAGVLSGTVSCVAATSTFTVRVQDSGGNVATKQFTLIVVPPLTFRLCGCPPDMFCAAMVCEPVSGGCPPYAYSVVGSLSPGLTLSPGGVISGEYSGPSFTLTIEVRDSCGNTATRQITITRIPPLTIATSSLPMGGAGVPYLAISLAATGGTGSGYIWSVSSGSLPPGLTLSPGGVLSGTPPMNSSAPYAFTIQVQDSGGATATKQFTLTVGEVLTVPTGSLPRATACATYPATILSASGGTGAGYIWSVGSGSLPAGLSLSYSGVLSGAVSCTATGSTFTVRVQDSGGNVATKQFTITVHAPAQKTAITADSPFQVNYAANLQAGESFVYVVNTGAHGAALLGPGFGPVGNICVNVYAFTPDEQLVSCCSCPVTPNGLVHLGAFASLASNTQTAGAGYLPGFDAANGTGGLVIKLVSTVAGGTAAGGASANCANSAAALTAPTTALAKGMVAWRTTVHNAPATAAPGAPGVGYRVTESAFVPATLSAAEMGSMSGRCASIIGNSSGYGVCRGCLPGALGAAR